MVNKSKILSDISKIAVDAMDTFSGVKKEVETIVSLKVNKVINKMNLVKRDEFEVLKKLVQKLSNENEKLRKKRTSKKKISNVIRKKVKPKRSKKNTIGANHHFLLFLKNSQNSIKIESLLIPIYLY